MHTEPEIPPISARRANTGSSIIRSRWMLFLLAIAAIASVTIGGWFWINRDVPLIHLKVGAGPFRSDSYELMREAADVVARHSDQIRLDVVATRDSSRNISLLNDGDLDLVTIRSDTPVISNIRLVADLFPDYFQIISHPDSQIFSVSDLVGRRVAIPPFGTDEFRSFWIIADHYDLPITDVKWLAMPIQKAAEDLLAHRIDAVFTVRSLRDRILLDLFADAKLKQIPIKLIEIDQAEAIALKWPFLFSASIPKGTYGGNTATPLRPQITPAVTRVLVTRKDIEPVAIAELTRVLFEHRLDLTIRFALASAVRQPDDSKGLNVPLHEGAAMYYDRNQPHFIQENAEPLALMVTLFAMIASGIFALRSGFIHRQKNRMDSYNYVLLDIAEKARQSNDAAAIREMKGEMFALLESTVRALDTDEVTEAGFQSFSLLWDSVREVLNERLDEIDLANRD